MIATMGTARIPLILIALLAMFGIPTLEPRASARADDRPDRTLTIENARNLVTAAERRRIDLIERISPACVSIFDSAQSGGGSGVIIDERGYGLTNFHVVAPMMGTRKGLGGLSDGKLYDLQVLGIDVTGDVAMFRLTGKDRYDHVELGDSDAVEVGDPVIAIGNPFTLAEDYKPTVTTGIVTGVHRYQGESDTLVYTDCIQTDAAINPGNSGGPLFNAEGRVIGINGRISAAMHRYARGRFNVGLGYAISINQIKRFIPHLRGGLLGKHGTLLATVIDDVDKVIFNDMYEDAPAWDAGIRVGDRLLRFGDQDIRSANHFASILGTYPENWPVPITFESRRGTRHKVVRLEPVIPPLSAPFVPIEQVNRDALRECLDRFQLAALGDDARTLPRMWTWKADRIDPEGNQTTIEWTDHRGRGAEIIESDADGHVLRRLEADEEGAYLVEGARRYPAPMEQSILLRGLRTLYWQLLDDDAADSEDAAYLGGDALIEIDDNGHITRQRMLETIDWPISDQVSLRAPFDLENYLPARLVIEDEPTETVVEIIFDNPRSAEGMRWLHEMQVKMPNASFTDSIRKLTVK